MQKLFWTDIRALRAHQEAAVPLLSKERQSRIARLRAADDRLRVMAAGLLLRYAFQDRAEKILLSESGKPYLLGEPCFSLSHGGDLAVLAVSDLPVGADVEPCAREASPAVLQKVLTEQEKQWLKEGNGTFAELWTRKESVMKADGRGLALAPGSFEVLDDRVFFYTLSSFEISGHSVAIAAENPAPFVLEEVKTEQLL